MLWVVKNKTKPISHQRSEPKSGEVGRLGRKLLGLCVCLNILYYPLQSQANFFKKAEKFVKGTGKAFEGLAKDVGKKVERGAKKTESNAKIIVKDGETVVKGVAESTKAPLRTAADIVSGGQTVRDREKAKANAEKEKAEIRRAQAEEIKKIAIQKTNENIANFEAELETIQIDLELLSLIKEKYSTIDENLEDLSLVALNLEESMSLFIKNVNAEHLMLIEKIDELIFISQPVFDGDMRNQKINFSKEISQIIHDIKVYEDGDVYRGENYSKLEEVSYEKIKILFIELDLALQECFVRLEQAVKSKIDRKTEIESSLGIEKQNLSKLSEER